MPLIAYQNAHGANDFPLHFAFFEALERRGVLDRFDFALDPFMDLNYCIALMQRFPQLTLTTDVSRISRVREYVYRRVGRGARAIATFESAFDAVCEAPGGRIHPLYTGGIDIFWRYPRTSKRAILFHSIEMGVLGQPETRTSIANADLIIARSAASAAVARQAGASNVISSTDIVLGNPIPERFIAGIAVALRVPNIDPTNEYFERLRRVLDYLETLKMDIDHVLMEAPMSNEQIARKSRPNVAAIRLWEGNSMYQPFTAKREAIISCRLHTTLMSILAGNRKIIQFQIEQGTSKIREIFDDLGLTGFRVHPVNSMRLETIMSFLHKGDTLTDSQVANALLKANGLIETGLGALENWLDGVG